jgi:integrase
MRKPQKAKCSKSKRYPNGVKFYGSVEYRGRQKWVGTFATRDEWNEAANLKEAALRREWGGPQTGASIPTVAEFVGVRVVETGRVEPRPEVKAIWPWTHRRGITKESSARTLSENIRPFVRAHGERRLVSFGRREARAIADGLTEGQKAAVRRLFADAMDDEIVESNPFTRLGIKQASRLEADDFEVISEAQLERFQQAALESRTDDYALTIHAAVRLESAVGIRPSEIFGLEWELLDRRKRCIKLRFQIDDRGEPVLLKSGEARMVPLRDEEIAAIDAAPVLSDRWIVPGPRGGTMKLSLWDRYWGPVRAAAGRPDFRFYDLKHRAITWMCTPAPDGLGLDIRDVARIVGHKDGGETIRKHYLRLDEHAAIQRFHAAAALVPSDGGADG